MNQAKLAKKVGVSREYINSLLKGRKTPSPTLAAKLETATGIAREVWVFGTPAERWAVWERFKTESKP